MSTSRFEEAAEYAEALHAAQRRKGTDIPYFTHLIGTAEIARKHGANETEQIAALLHDAIEDQPRDGKTADEIRERFGEAVAFSIVMGCTDGIPEADGKKPLWEDRKPAYIAHLRTAPPSVLLVSASDKLYNARSIVGDFKSVGDEVFERFTASKEKTQWYYRELVKAFRDAGGPKALVDELDAVVTELERL